VSIKAFQPSRFEDPEGGGLERMAEKGRESNAMIPTSLQGNVDLAPLGPLLNLGP
jgi:hypothetical protein